MGFLDKFAAQILGLARIVSGLIFLEHGTMKVLGFPAGMHPPLASLPGAAGVIELVAGVLIVLGFYSRIAAFIASGEMAFAYFLGHFPHGFFPAQNGGDAAVLYCFLFLYLAAAGPGAFAANKK